MTENPYEPPKSQTRLRYAESRLKKQARLSLRLAATILFLPAIYNYWEFDAQEVSPLPDDLAKLCRAVNILGIAVSAVVIWFLRLPVLEALARLLRALFASATDRSTWEDVLYQSMPRMIYLAVPGAALWTFWVFAIYQRDSDFHTISWAVGIPAHLLAACWYVPLLHRWYRLAQTRGQ